MDRKEKKIMEAHGKILCQQLGEEQGRAALHYAMQEFDALCRENADEPKAVRQHTHSLIYPGVALFRALLAAGKSREEAVRAVGLCFAAQAEKEAQSLRSLLKLPGLYRLMPKMWRIVTKTQFGEAAGFRWKFYPTGSDRVKFDMLECPFCRICEKCGCRELVPVFCRMDDIKNGNQHPKLKWNRTKTLGDGDDLCDFDVIVLK